MSDDLTKRLRDNTRNYDDKITDRLEAADRIEELEAKNGNLMDLSYGEHKRAMAAEAKLTRAMECIPSLIVIALDNLDAMNAETRNECESDIAKARAAPDLYEALEEATKWIKWHREHPNTINNNSYLFDNKANAALAKARGETND